MNDEMKADITSEAGLTNKEEAFLDFLFDYCNGNIREAMTKAGYPKDAPESLVTKPLAKEIKKRAKEYLTAASAKASISLVNVIVDPNQVGAKNVIAASNSVLDRAGVFKEEAPQVTEVRNMFILPAKDEVVEDE